MIDHFQRSALNFFAASPVDRQALMRRDAGWLAEQLHADATRFVPVWRAQNLITSESEPEAVLPTYNEIEVYLDQSSPILLGQLDGTTYFALGLPAQDETIPEQFNPVGIFRDLRLQTDKLPVGVADILVFGKGMAYWHQRHRYCGDCGHPTQSQEAGYMLECTSEECQAKQFPRMDPAIIVLVYDGERCLLARQPTWPEGRYSVVAGFVEPGESLEDAVLREVAEETNVTVSSVHYHSSQPWPFPSSLMLGYMAQAASTDIHLNDAELEHAHWLSRADIVQRVKDRTLMVPPPISISHRLIETWFNQGNQGTLSDLLKETNKINN
ncbi:MAG: NAD(+) diphosphatase [Chloroflexota bacterium]